MYLDPRVPLLKDLLMLLTDAEEDSEGGDEAEEGNPRVAQEEKET